MITVDRSIHIEGSSELDEVVVGAISYASPEKNVLVESVDTFAGEHYLRRSTDNGRTWLRCEDWVAKEPLRPERQLVRGLLGFFLDKKTGWMFRCYFENESIPDMAPWDKDAPDVPTRRNFIQISKDEGRTWSEPEQLIMTNEGCDEVHWAPGIWYGKNSGYPMTGNARQAPDGAILMPFCMNRLFDNDTVRSPEYGGYEHRSSCCLGRWHEDGSGIDFLMGEYITLPRKYSADGADEPSFDYMPSGRLFVSLRARRLAHAPLEIPGCKHFAVSDDDGHTWSDAGPMLYDDGEYVLSPASYSVAIRSSKNGRLYLITNFVDVNPMNCDPRTVLQIAEVDTDTLRIIRDSLTVIEQRTPDQPEYIRFSNFPVYEDHETGDIVLLMAHNAGDTGRSPDCKISPHNFRYDIHLPDE